MGKGVHAMLDGLQRQQNIVEAVRVLKRPPAVGGESEGR